VEGSKREKNGLGGEKLKIEEKMGGGSYLKQKKRQRIGVAVLDI